MRFEDEMRRFTIDVDNTASNRQFFARYKGMLRERFEQMRLAAAVKWYELKLLSQERAARVAGVSRAEFLDVLGRFGVSPFQYGADEVLEEAGRE